jgi:hypothetical protein
LRNPYKTIEFAFLDGQLTLLPALAKMILASATTHRLEEHITGFRAIDSKVPSRSITKLEKAIKVRANSLRLTSATYPGSGWTIRSLGRKKVSTLDGK